jgi:hypothetical protein
MIDITRKDINKVFRTTTLICLASQEDKNFKHSIEGLEELLEILEELKEIYLMECVTFFVLYLSHLFKFDKGNKIFDAPQSEITNVVYYDF